MKLLQFPDAGQSIASAIRWSMTGETRGAAHAVMVRTALPLMLRWRSASSAWQRPPTARSGHVRFGPADCGQGEQRGNVRADARTRSVIRKGVNPRARVNWNELAESDRRQFALLRWLGVSLGARTIDCARLMGLRNIFLSKRACIARCAEICSWPVQRPSDRVSPGSPELDWPKIHELALQSILWSPYRCLGGKGRSAQEGSHRWKMGG
jgi:hypothetical protein